MSKIGKTFASGFLSAGSGGMFGDDADELKDDARRSKRKAKDQKKRADDLTNSFGRTLLNNPLGKSSSLLQGRPGSAASSGSVLG
jgi:hypothetical protein